MDRLTDSDFLRINQATEAEKSVIGCAIDSPEALEDLCSLVSADDFRNDLNRRVWSEIVSVRASGVRVDALTLDASLRASGYSDAVGSVSGLRAWADTYGGGDHVSHATIVRRSGKRRRLARLLVTLVDEIPEDPADVDTFASSALERFRTVCETGFDPGAWDDPMEAVQRLIQAIRSRVAGEVEPGVTSGIAELDRIVNRWRAGAQIVVGARPSVGKSMFAGTVAVNHAASGGAALIFSAEMSSLELRERFLARQSGLGMSKVSGHAMTDGDGRRIIAACEKQVEMRLRIVDQPKTVDEIAMISRRWIRDAECGPGDSVGLIVVDYLQILPAARRYSNRQEEVSASSVALKRLARELGVVMLTLSQLNRLSERRDDGRPAMSDLRESGSIEQDADQIICLHRPRLNDGGLDPEGALLVLKNRNGPTGDVGVFFDVQKQEVR